MKQVLVVDEDLSSALAVERALLLLGCKVTTAIDGCTAVKRAIGEKYDAAVIDMDMRDCEGMAAVEAIRMVDPDVRIVVVGNGDGEAVCKAAQQARAQGCLTKPIDEDQLSLVLSTVVSGVPCQTCCDVVASTASAGCS